jgi:hypothetical protein
MAIGVGGPHDGVSYNGRIYFTTVNGCVVIANPKNGRIESVVDLNGITHERGPLGWCRGIYVLDENRVIVGFSRLRSTKFQDNLAWVKRWAKKGLGLEETFATKPTRIALYDLRLGKLCWEKGLEEVGLNAIFSIHALDS